MFVFKLAVKVSGSDGKGQGDDDPRHADEEGEEEQQDKVNGTRQNSDRYRGRVQG